MAVDGYRKMATVTLGKGLERPPPIGGRSEFILRHVRWFSESNIR
jgi:hypothetical protein